MKACFTNDPCTKHKLRQGQQTTQRWRKRFGPKKRCECAWPPSVFIRLRPCWLSLFPKVKHLEGACAWFDFEYPQSYGKYIGHHCEGRHLQRHPDIAWPCKSVYTLRIIIIWIISNVSLFSFDVLFLSTLVLKLSWHTDYITDVKVIRNLKHFKHPL